MVVLGALTAFAPFTIDTYLPSFPALVIAFRAPEWAIQVTLAGTMIGFAIGQLVVGPWSDQVGRKLPLLVSCGIHVGASILIACAQDLPQLVGGRLLQGFGAAASAVVALAIARDLFGGILLVRALSRIALVSGLAPLIAPVLGSQLLIVGDWRGIFVFLACYAVIMLVFSQVVLPESLPLATRLERTSTTTRARYAKLLRDPSFVGLMIMSGLRFTALFAFLQASPFLLQDEYGLDAQQFGVAFAIITLGMMAGVQSSSRLAHRIGPVRVLVISLSILTAVGTAIAVLGGLPVGVGWMIVLFVLFMLGCGLGLPMIQSLALRDHPEEAGTAAALIGASSFGASALLAPALSGTTVVLGHSLSLGIACVLSSLLSAAALRFLVTRPATE